MFVAYRAPTPKTHTHTFRFLILSPSSCLEFVRLARRLARDRLKAPGRWTLDLKNTQGRFGNAPSFEFGDLVQVFVAFL